MSKTDYATDPRALLRELERHGCQVRRTGSKHLRITLEGRYVTILPSTLGDNRRGLRNCVAEVRRAGIALPH